MYNEIELREKLKKYRQDRNLNQTQLAELVGVSRTQITQLESGSRKPTLNIMKKIAKGTNTPLSYWLENLQLQEIAPFDGLDIILDKLIQDQLIDETGDFDKEIEGYLLEMLKQEIKLKIYKKKKLD